MEDNLCHKTTYSRKIELNKHMYHKKVKTTTALEALLYFICFRQTIKNVSICGLLKIKNYKT